jgi:hypothetical protein
MPAVLARPALLTGGEAGLDGSLLAAAIVRLAGLVLLHLAQRPPCAL